MGTGKSAVGKRLSVRLQRAFLDTDALIAAAAGHTIPEIFAAEGEGGFRDRETAFLRRLVGATGAIIVTGCGELGRDENVCLHRRIGSLACLSSLAARHPLMT